MYLMYHKIWWAYFLTYADFEVIVESCYRPKRYTCGNNFRTTSVYFKIFDGVLVFWHGIYSDLVFLLSKDMYKNVIHNADI